MQTRNNFSSDISIDESFRKLEMFSKDIELPITSDKPDNGDGSFWNIVDLREFEFRRRQDWNASSFLDNLEGGLTPKAAIAMVLVMEELKVLGPGSEVTIAPKNHCLLKNLRL